MKTALYDVVDISVSQANVLDAQKLKSKVGGVIIKLGYTGYGSMRPTISQAFWNQYKACKAAGIPVGVYYFTLAYNDALVKMETDWVLDQLKDLELELPVYLDSEGQPNCAAWTNCTCKTRTDCTIKWLQTIEDAGYYVGIYGGKAKFTEGIFIDDSRLKAYDHWLAQYNTEVTYKGDYNMWQYTSKANPAEYGLSGTALDVSHCYVDYPSIIRKAGLNHLVPTVVEEKPVESETVVVEQPTIIKTITLDFWSDGHITGE